MTLAPSPDTIVDLLLVRTLFSGTSTKVHADLSKLLDGGLPVVTFDDMRRRLVSDGYLSIGKRNKYDLTESGRARALGFLGTQALPPRANWTSVIVSYVFPRASGLSSESVAKLKSGDSLAAVVLKRKYGLPNRAGTTVKAALEALVCKELGYSEETTLEGLLCAVGSKLLGVDRLTKQKLVKQLPLYGTGLKSTSANDIRIKMVRDWLSQTNRSTTATADAHFSRSVSGFDLLGFAKAVQALAGKSPPEDRFHNTKAFIAPLWRASQVSPEFPKLSLAEFKQKLVEANMSRLLHLSTADLVSAMNPLQVSESETLHLHARFHFVLIEGERQ